MPSRLSEGQRLLPEAAWDHVAALGVGGVSGTSEPGGILFSSAGERLMTCKAVAKAGSSRGG